MTLHELLDWHFGRDGLARLRRELARGADPNEPAGPRAETPLHVATRRRRLEAVEVLLDHDARLDARTAGGKTAYAHAARRGFDEIASALGDRGADRTLTPADRLAVALVRDRLDDARDMLVAPGLARTGNAEEDRLLADLAGRRHTEPVRLLIEAGADLSAPGLDSGAPLHQAAWFGQPENASLLVAADAPLEVFDGVHESSPLGWATHGSRYSGDASRRQDAYVAIAKMLLAAGARLHYPGDPDGDAYLHRLLQDASEPVRLVLREAAIG